MIVENYIKTLAELGKSPLLLNKICILPFSGRVMGLYPQEDLNVFWINPALNATASASDLLTSGKWTNLGGDRTWISPEIELFIPDLASPRESYQVPACIDPANYQVLFHHRNMVELETTLMVNFFRSDCKTGLLLNKRITELDIPDFPLPPEVSSAGYELKCTLSALGIFSPAVRPAIWNLLQVPGGGNIVVPVRNQSIPASFFGRQQYRHGGDHICAAIPVLADGYKFGIHAEHCSGLMLYLNLTAPQPFMVVRRFNVGFADEYFDVPFSNSQQPGSVQQVYVDDGTYGGFGEMEYHSTAIMPGICAKITDICTTWSFTGSATKLKDLSETLLTGKAVKK